MNNSRPNYRKFSLLLVCNNKLMFLLSLTASILGFTFLFTIPSLCGTIVQSRQDTAVGQYGKFLAVMSDVNRNQIEDIKKANTAFDYFEYKIEGNIEYNKNKIAIGSMKEELGDKFGFQLLEGEWPSDANEIVIEEYLRPLLGIENQALPLSVTLQKDGKPASYKVTGIISNYSSELSACSDNTLDTKVYPSIILGMDHLQNGKTSLVIAQKTLALGTLEDEMNSVWDRCQEIIPSMENVTLNDKLQAYGYDRNKNMIISQRIYQILINALLILEQLVILRFILNKNKRTLSLFEALGLSPRQRRKVMLGLNATLMGAALIISYLVANMIGFLYMKKEFVDYMNHYASMVRKNFLFECAIVCLLLAFFYIAYGKVKRKSITSGMVKSRAKESKGYQFKKIDFCTIVMQIICMFFMMGSMYFMAELDFEQEEFEYHLYSKQSVVSIPAQGYNIAGYKDRYFSFDSIDSFKGYESYLSLSTAGDTRLASIILEKDSKDGYFKENENAQEQSRVKQIPKEAEQYKVIPERYLEVKVLPKEEFMKFMKENGIVNQALKNEEDGSCIVLAPNYNTEASKASLRKQGDIELGRIQYNKNELAFEKAKFKIEELLTPEDQTSRRVQLIMSERVARQSNFIIGYNRIIINMLEETPESIQKEIEQKVSLLMATTQGGMLDSSIEVAKESSLMKGYTTRMCNSILFFCTISIFIYVLLSSYIDWEKNKHDYAVLRSFGMSYSELQHNLFLKHSNGIVVAGIIAMIVGKRVFTTDVVSTVQRALCFVVVVVITYLCRFLVYKLNKTVPVSSMLNEN